MVDMAKDKEKIKGVKGVPNKHLHARVSFLQQASVYLASKQLNYRPTLAQDVRCSPQSETLDVREGDTNSAVDVLRTTGPNSHATSPGLVDRAPGDSSHLVSQMKQVAQKSQIRLHPAVKRATCKTCNAVLIAGESCNKFVENLSRHGRKPQADVLVLQCCACGTRKHYPIGAKRQQRKSKRADKP